MSVSASSMQTSQLNKLNSRRLAYNRNQCEHSSTALIDSTSETEQVLTYHLALTSVNKDEQWHDKGEPD